MHIHANTALFLAELQVFDIDRLLRGIERPYAIPVVAATPPTTEGNGRGYFSWYVLTMLKTCAAVNLPYTNVTYPGTLANEKQHKHEIEIQVNIAQRYNEFCGHTTVHFVI